jgi:TolB-like protein/DNA-binding SARP family transcriptional activator
MENKCSLRLLGPFSLQSPTGVNLAPKSQKWRALMAMLATAPNGRRSRKWLQARLWSTGDDKKGGNSLRQALHKFREKLGEHSELITSDGTVVRLDLSMINIDILRPDLIRADSADLPEFLEGINVPVEGFEDWLLEQRQYWVNDLTVRLGDCRPAGVVERSAPMLVGTQGAETNAPAPQKHASQTHTSQNYGSHVQTARTPDTGPRVLAPVVNDAMDSTAEKQRRPKNFAAAVLPLTNLTGDSQFDFFADGLSETLIDRLAKLCWLPIISRSSSFMYRAANLDLFAIGDWLRAKYLVNGTLTRQGAQMQIRVELHNTEDCSSLWTDAYLLDDSLQSDDVDHILSEIIGKLDSIIDQFEQRASVRPDYVALGYNENIWRGRWYLNKLTREDSVEARRYFDLALADNPNDPEALLQSATWHVLQLWINRGTAEDVRKVMPHLLAAQEANVLDSRGYTILGMAEMWMRNYDAAIKHLEQAIEYNPSCAKPHEQLGCCYYLIGEAGKAIPALEEAIRISPNDQHLFFPLGELAMARLMAEQFEEALQCATQALVYRPNYWYPQLIRLEALQRLGRSEEYRQAKMMFESENIALGPSYLDWVPFKDPRWIETLKAHAV